MSTVIQISNLSKIYRLGEIGTGTISRDLERWFKMKILKQEDPFLKIGETNVRNSKGVSDVVYALKDINFEVQQGEALGIIGKNGAGKSTLLKILSRVTSPTTGKINIKGRVASLLEVGTGFHPELTGRENIYLNGAILGMRKKEITQKLAEIINFSGVERYIDTPVKRYSSGMYVRLAFAVAAHLESEIMIVDEVLAVGDAEFQKKCLGKMQDVSTSQGRTIIFVSHNMGAIKTLCNKAVTLVDGKKSFEGDVFTAISKYITYVGNDKVVLRWDEVNRPSIPAMQLIEVGILNNGHFVGTEISAELPIQIYIKFIVQKETKVGTTVLLYNSDGILIFSSMSNHEPNWHNKVRPLGIYKSICEIPANLLADGKYTISIPFWEGFYEIGHVEKDVLQFTVHEKGFVRGDLPYPQSGHTIQPLLKWISILES